MSNDNRVNRYGITYGLVGLAASGLLVEEAACSD